MINATRVVDKLKSREREVILFPGDKESITLSDFDEIEWWKYRQLDLKQFEVLESILPRKASGSPRKILFGDESSSCLSLFMQDQKIVEISIRIDLREDFNTLLNYICELASENNCLLLSNDLKILYPNLETVRSDLESYDGYKSFLDKLK